jgi:molecular chaperone GrpE (heat shock protein)
MALTNAEKQKRWRDKRNALAKLAEQQQKNGGYVTSKKTDAALKARIAELEDQRRAERRMYLRVVAELNKLKEHPGRRSGAASAFTSDLSTQAKAMLKRLTRHRGCNTAAMIERLATNEEHRVVARLKGKALKTYCGD